MNASPQVAVIGGAGLIGSAVVEALADCGYKPVILDIERPPQANSKCEFGYFDLTQPATWLKNWTRFEAIVIAAAMLTKRCNESPRDAWSLNVTGTIRLIDTVASHNPAPAVVFLSSASVYDQAGSSPPFAENAKIRAHDIYSASKICVELALVAATKAGILKGLILRPFTVYGTGPLRGERGHLFGSWLELGRRKRPLTIHGDGKQLVDPVKAELVADACVAYLRQELKPNLVVANVSSGKPIEVRRLAEIFVAAGAAQGFIFDRSVNSGGSAWGTCAMLETLIGRKLQYDAAIDILNFLTVNHGFAKAASIPSHSAT